MIAFRKILETYPGTVFAVAFAVLYVPLARLGLNLTDPGFHLTNQEWAFERGWEYVIAQWPWWFSDFIGGLYLHVMEPFGFLGARLGRIGLIIITGVLSLRLVQRVFGKHWSLPFAALAGAGFFGNYQLPIDYYSVPAFFAVGYAYLFILGLQAEAPRRQLQFGMASGLILAALIFSRLPALIMIGAPVLIAGLGFAWGRSAGTAACRVSASSLVVAAICIGLFAFGLHASGHLPAYLDALLSSQGQQNSLMDLIRASWFQFTFSWIRWVLFGLAFVAALFYTRQTARAVFGSAAALACLSIVLFAGGIESWIPYTDSRLNPVVIVALIALISFPFLFASFKSEQDKILFTALFILCGASVLAVGFGSGAGLVKLRYGALPLTILAVAALGRLHAARRLNFRRAFLTTFMIGFLALMTIHGRIVLAQVTLDRPFGLHRISPRVGLRLDYPLESTRLRGILTTKGRRASFDELIAAIMERTNPGDRIFGYGPLSLMYYASYTRPVTRYTVYGDEPSVIAKDLRGLCEGK